jgi:hypothetical protein
MEEKNHISLFDLSEHIQDLFGGNYKVLSILNMHGGAQKVVYKVECTHGFTCMLYVWDESMNYFQEEKLKSEMFFDSNGAELFEYNNLYLLRQGIRTPKIYLINKEKNRYPFDYAIVECIRGGNLEQYFHREHTVKDKVLKNFAEMLEKMHSIRASNYGKLKHNDDLSSDRCEMIVFKNTIEELLHISEHVERIAVNKDRLVDVLNELFSEIKIRDEYGVIHGELGPDHVLVDENLETYLIDIEGTMFFDVEFEHSFLQFRFGDCYAYLINKDLDPDRLLFYKLCHHISCTCGGLKLLQRDFPNKALAQEIFESNCNRALKFLDVKEI